jgi:hypothetical protein
MSVTADVASSAIGASGEIAAAAVDMVQNAAESLASVATGGARDSTDNSGETDSNEGQKGRGEQKS